MKPRKLTKTMKEQMQRAEELKRLRREYVKEHRKSSAVFQMNTNIAAKLYKNDIPSIDNGGHDTIKRSIMEDRFKESSEVRKEIEYKSTCLAPAYNKGAVQYISDRVSAYCAGRKTT